VLRLANETPSQVKRIRGVLTDRGVSGLRDLALFSVAIDTMLQGPELLAMTVKDVQIPSGTIRSVIKVARTGRKPPVRCALSEKTAKSLGKWIAVSGTKGADYIFPSRSDGPDHRSTTTKLAARPTKTRDGASGLLATLVANSAITEVRIIYLDASRRGTSLCLA
jgi:integrase